MKLQATCLYASFLPSDFLSMVLDYACLQVAGTESCLSTEKLSMFYTYILQEFITNTRDNIKIMLRLIQFIALTSVLVVSENLFKFTHPDIIL